MPPKKEFLWTDDEVELLLNITHEYKTAKAAECTDWESVKSKYADILDLFKEHSPGSDDERKQLDKDYRGIGIGRATGARAPLNFPVGGLKLTKLVGLDTVAALIIMHSNVRSGLRNLDNFKISLTVN